MEDKENAYINTNKTINPLNSGIDFNNLIRTVHKKLESNNYEICRQGAHFTSKELETLDIYVRASEEVTRCMLQEYHKRLTQLLIDSIL